MGETDKVWSSVKKFVGDNKDKSLYIAGHSLGGAMASVASSRLQNNENLKMTYTYGSPRVGNSTWTGFQKWSHQRIQNNNDVVTQTPPMLLGFRHHYPSVYINHYGNIRKLTRWQKIKDMFRGRWQAIKKLQFFDGIYDHNMDKYCSKLHKVWEHEVYAHRSEVSSFKHGQEE
jgi:predicted lipase